MAGIIFFSLYLYYKKQYTFIDELKNLSASDIDKVEIFEGNAEKLLPYKGEDVFVLNEEQHKIIKSLLSEPFIGESPSHAVPKVERVVRFEKNGMVKVEYTFLIYKRQSRNLYVAKENWTKNKDGITYNSIHVIVVIPGGASVFTKILEEIDINGS